jgi:hypothetical protein
VTTCSECSRPTEQVPGKRDRLTCGATCRKKKQRRLHAEANAQFRAAALDLLMRQTQAVINGDADELARVQRDAARLFGE